ncbi:hypothetical protein ACFOJ6_03345 [Gordonia humi]|uniref:hypothetical protein n=1 Tax=Gordonia humi TaxID=686429 RepID=UPI0036187B8E
MPTWVILGASVAFYVIGAALLTRENTAVDVPDLILPFVLLGAGFGLGVGLVDGQAIGSVPEEKSGMVSGLVSTVRLGSEAVVVAVFASALSVGVGGKVRQVLPDTLDAGDQDTIVDRVVTGRDPRCLRSRGRCAARSLRHGVGAPAVDDRRSQRSARCFHRGAAAQDGRAHHYDGGLRARDTRCGRA